MEFVAIPTGTFRMGNEDEAGYPGDGEDPVRDVTLGAFEIATTAISNADFAEFREATGFVTVAEQLGSAFVFGGLLPDDFPPTQGVASAPWWRLVEGATWDQPEGPQSDVNDRQDHPAVHISWTDAVAYCEWLGGRLPTEAEWEYAARGGLDQKRYPWGDNKLIDGTHHANVWQGTFPAENTQDDGWYGTAPVNSFDPNGYGLYCAVGNAWEWCADWFDPMFHRTEQRLNPTGPPHGSHRVMRGGSYLCHESYCFRFRVAARSANMPDASTGNLGFRVARDVVASAL